MTLTNTTASESHEPEVTDSSETDVFQETTTARYIKDGKNQMLVTADNKLVGPLATISPAEFLRFQIVDDTKETLGDVLKIFNPSRTQNITYKMLLNWPYTYRVTKCVGIIKPQETVDVRMVLCPDEDGSHHRRTNDRFPIQIMEIDNNITELLDIKRFWDKLDQKPANFMKHKLSCIVKYPKGPELDHAAIEVLVDDLNDKITEVRNMVDSESLARKKLLEEQDKVIEELLITLRKEVRIMEEEQRAMEEMQRQMGEAEQRLMEEELRLMEAEQRLMEEDQRLMENQRQIEEMQRRQTSTSRIVMFQTFIMMLLAWAFFVIFCTVYDKEPFEDLSHCNSSFENPVDFPCKAY